MTTQVQGASQTQFTGLEFFESAQFKQALTNALLTVESKGNKGPSGPIPESGKPSLTGPDGNLNADSLALLLMELRGKTDELQAVSSKESIEFQKTKKVEANKKMMEKLEKYHKKMKEAKKAGLASKIFGWVGVGLTVLAAAAAVVVTGGAAAPLVAAAVIAVTMQVLNETGVMQDLMEKSPEAYWAVFAVTTALQIGLSIGGGIAVANAAAQASLVGVKAAANTVQIVANVAGGVAAVGGGASGIATAVITKDAEDERAESVDIKKLLARLTAMLEDEMDRLKQVMEQAEEGMSIVTDIIKQSNESNQHIIQQTV